MDGILL